MVLAPNARQPKLPPRPALREAAAFLVRLSDEPSSLASWLLLLEEARGASDWYVAHRYDAPDVSLQVFVWPSGTRTQIHDHSSWGAFCCIAGALFEERYERLDDGSRPDHARLKMLWRRVWSLRNGVSTVLPYGGGIHRVGTAGRGPAVSVHLYGPRMGNIDGRDYDPSRDYVCDRPDDAAGTAEWPEQR
jgi:predicted metal-dependent enzyme (double-stranded beta helix superfamily)